MEFFGVSSSFNFCVWGKKILLPFVRSFFLTLICCYCCLWKENTGPMVGVQGCPRTASTPAPVTTTSTTTTTTTTPSPCMTCTPGQITLTPGNGVTTFTPTTPGVGQGSGGCFNLMVTCTNPAGGQVFMQFNTNQGGPVMPVGNPISVTLNCVNGQWTYQPGMGLPDRVITEVNCQVAQPPGR